MTGETTARQVLADAAAADAGALDNFVIRGEVLAEADVTRFDLEADMAADVLDDVQAAVTALTVKQFLSYDPSYQTSASQVLVEDLAQIPELAAVDGALRVGNVPLDAGGQPAVALAHAMGTGAQRVVAYRLKGPGIVTRRPRGIPLLPRDGVYRRVAGDLLYYEPRFDAFTCSGFAYFTTVTLIQTKLHADDKARQLARATLDTVTTNVTIHGYEDLQRAVMDDPSMRAKMAYVARLLDSDPEYAESLTSSNLIQFVEANPDYDIPMSTVEGRKALLFDPSPQHRHQIPRLLADDYLHSFLTERNYEAGSKQWVQG